jgi:hypothetical protein
VRHAIETLGNENSDECDGEKGESRDMTESDVMSEEVAHIGAEYARQAQRCPIAKTQNWYVHLLHGMSGRSPKT